MAALRRSEVWRRRSSTVHEIKQRTDNMKLLGDYTVIDTMELRVVDQTKDSGGIATVAANTSAPAASVLGAACQEFKIPLDTRLGIYTENHVMLTERKEIASYKLETGDTVYLRPKAAGDDLLFLINWRILAMFLTLIALVGITIVVTMFAATAGRAPFVYGVVIDAGSSHSEATLYHWDGSKFFGTGKALQVAHKETDSSGISDLQPREVQRVLENLLDDLKTNIPPQEMYRTKVYLAATAGMRLLNITDPTRTDLNFLAAEAAIKGSGMSFGSAGILSGQHEGLSAWLSANYLLDKLPKDHSTPQDLVGALDCGGASTQIAFEVARNSNHPEFHLMKLYGNEYNVFSRTYLCYGINEAFNRYVMMLLSEQKYETTKPIESPCHNKGYDQSMPVSRILTPCTTHKELPEVLYRRNTSMLRIIGTGESAVCQNTVANLFPEKDCRIRGFSECFKKIPIAIPEINFSALSGFTYTVEELRFNGTSMDQLGKSVGEFCRQRYDTLKAEVYAGKDKYAAFGCFKAAFIYNLLQNYGVNDENFGRVSFLREAKGYNLGWSLGYMINATNAIPEAKPDPAIIPTPLFAIVIIIFASTLGTGVFAYLINRRRAQRLAQANAEKEEKEELTLKETAA